MSALTPESGHCWSPRRRGAARLFFCPGVKLDFREMPDGHVVDVAEVAAELRRIGHELKPFDIVLVGTRAASCIGSGEYLAAGAELDASLRHSSRKN